MEEAPTPDDEAKRLQVLERYAVRDPDEEQIYEQLARLASYVTGASFGLMTMIGEENTWVKARRNFEAEKVDRAISFCAHLVEIPEELLVVEDAREDPRFEDNPLVVEEPGIRFYAGCPLVAPEDHVIGALCVFDTEPRSLDQEQRELLRVLGHQAMTNLVARRRIRDLDEQIDGLGRV